MTTAASWPNRRQWPSRATPVVGSGPPGWNRSSRYLDARRLDARPSTVIKLELGLRRFMEFVTPRDPQITKWAQVTRDDALAFAAHLEQATGYRSGHPLRAGQTGRPLATTTKRNMLSAVSVFSADAVSWGWLDGPTLAAAAGAGPAEDAAASATFHSQS